MGGVALLLWGLHMVHSGILRAFGPDLRSFLAKALKTVLRHLRLHRPDRAAAKQYRDRPDHQLLHRRGPGQPGSGAGDHARRQCRHHADVQILSFNIAAAAPVLFILGLVPRSAAARRSRIKDLGRVSIGLGLMLLALHILLDTAGAGGNAPGVRVFMTAITGDPVLCHRPRRCP